MTGAGLFFKTDGSMASNIDGYANFNRYEEISDRKIKLLNAGNNSSEIVMIEFNAKGLKTNRGLCVEGCGEIFTR